MFSRLPFMNTRDGRVAPGAASAIVADTPFTRSEGKHESERTRSKHVPSPPLSRYRTERPDTTASIWPRRVEERSMSAGG